MLGCAVVIALVVAVIAAGVTAALMNVPIAIATFIVVFFIAFGYLAQGVAIGNMATQDKRDQAIIDELKKINNEDE